MYASGEQWHDWMKDFRFGTLVYLPEGNLRSAVDRLREQYDPVSAKACAAHITLTQPFAKAPSLDDREKLQQLISAFVRTEAQAGPAVTSPNQKLLWLDVSPKKDILALRGRLHETGLFRTDLPLTKGFIPHMTISEQQRDPQEVNVILKDLNSRLSPWSFCFDQVSWIIPNESFVFEEFKKFPLK